MMATVKCALGKRGRASHEWNDGEKDRIYCLGWVDHMTDCPLPECLACPDFVDKAQDDLEAFYGGGRIMTLTEMFTICDSCVYAPCLCGNDLENCVAYVMRTSDNG